MNRHSLKFKVTVLVLFIVLIFFTANGLVSVIQFRNSMRDLYYETARTKMNATVNEIDGFFNEQLKLTWTMAMSQNIRDFCRNTTERFHFLPPQTQTSREVASDWDALPGDIKELSKTLSLSSPQSAPSEAERQQFNQITATCRRIIDTEPYVTLAYVAVENTQEYFTDPEIFTVSQHYYIRNRGWYSNSIDSQESRLTPPYIDKVTGKLVVSAVTPIWDDDDTLLGAAATDFRIDTVGELVGKLKLTDNSFAYLVDEQGLVLSHNNNDFLMSVVVAEHEAFPKDLKDNFDELLAGSLPYLEFEGRNSMGQEGKWVLFTAPLKTTAWHTILVVKQEDILSEVQEQIVLLVIINAIFLLAMGFLLFLLVKKLMRPIEISSKMLIAVSQGDLTVKADASLFRRKDELGELSRSIQEMIERLSDSVFNVRDVSNSISSGSSQLNDSSQALSSGAAEQAASVEEISSSMEEMASNVAQNSDNAKQTETIANQAAQNTEESGKAAMEAVEAMNMIAEKISVVQEIAGQTNLLALNAAIEAARAGESGKGFAVVADEVRKLAERSQKAANEISELAGKTVESSQTAGSMLEQLVPDIRNTAHLVQEISAANVEQTSGINQITESIQQLDKVIQQNAASSEELASTSETLNGMALQLIEIMEFFKLKDR